jgi:MFS transporter, YNFM family, putative membrane transport protein
VSAAQSEEAAVTRLIWVLGACGFASTFTMRLIDPLIPTLATEFDRSIPEVAMIATAFSLCYALGQPFLGPIADSLGKIRTMRVCIVVVTALLLVSALATSLGALFAVRMVMGVFAGGLIPVAMAAIGDRVPVDRRQIALGRFLTVMIIGQTAGSALSGVIADHFGWRTVMVVGSFVAALGAAAIIFAITPRANVTRQPLGLRSALAGYRTVFANPRSLLLYGLVVCEGAIIFGIMPYVAAILKDRTGVGPTEAGLVVGAAGVGGLLYGFLVQRLVSMFGQQRMMRLGGIVMALAITVFAMPFLPWWVGLLSFGVQGFAFFLMHGTFQAQATELAPAARGSAMALFAFSLFVGHAVGPVIMGAFKLTLGPEIGLLILAAAMAVLAFVAPRLLRA